MNWANDLDMLAQNGVLDFDAPSYVMGQKPRYVGNPAHPDPFNGQPPSVPKLEQPKIDEFKPEKENIVKTSSWKKWAFGAIALGAVIFGGLKFKSKLIPWIKKGFGKINLKTAGSYIKGKCTSAGNFFKTGWNKFTGLFHKNKP